LRRESADRGAVKRQVVPALDQKFLVVIKHVQAAFQIAEQHRNGLDPLFVRQKYLMLLPESCARQTRF